MANRRPADPPGKSEAGSLPTDKSPPQKRPARAKKVVTQAAAPHVVISEDVRRGMIAEAAYLRAERRGFTGGREAEAVDWLIAEAEVDALLRAEHAGTPQ